MPEKDDNTFSFEQLAEAYEGLAEEISRRDPKGFAAAMRDGRGTLALLDSHPDLSARFRARLDAIRERRKHLRVKAGDWVTINGSRFRIGHVNPRTGTVSTERLDRAGGLISMDQVDGSRLLPDAAPPSPEELDPVGPGSARERLDRHVSLLSSPRSPPGAPAALAREGAARILELAWTTPLPEQPLSATHLARYWRWLLDTRRARRQQLDEDPGTSADPDGLAQWRRERRIQIHYYEAVLALLHGIVAPEAPYLCGADCTHLGGGATREQLQRFSGALAAFRADTEYESEENTPSSAQRDNSGT